MAPRTRSLERLLAEYRDSGKSPLEVSALKSILTARTDAGLSQKEVAEKMGATQSCVARLENNLLRGRFPSMATLEKYASAVGKRVEVRFV